jgi:hypothetical protein
MLHTRTDAQRRRLRRVGKTCQSAPNARARRLGQDEQYLNVREILFRARSQMAHYHASVAIFTGLGMQNYSLFQYMEPTRSKGA